MIAVTPRAVLFAPGRYFVHPAFDYLLVGGGLSLVFAVAMATMQLDLTLNGWLATLIIVANGAHFAASTVRLYTRPGVTRSLVLITDDDRHPRRRDRRPYLSRACRCLRAACTRSSLHLDR